MTPKPERRGHPMRRQVNEAFCGPDGRFSIGKFLMIWTQIVVLGHMGTSWERLIDKPETLAIILLFLIAPDLLKKALVMKLGSGK
jgi:hypothetical protein